MLSFNLPQSAQTVGRLFTAPNQAQFHPICGNTCFRRFADSQGFRA